MEPNDKKIPRDRILKNFKKHHRSREEEKAIAENTRAKRANRESKKPRRKRWRGADEGGEETLEFERIKSSPRVDLDRNRAVSGVGDKPKSMDADGESTQVAGELALVVEVHRDRLRVRGERGDEDVALSAGASAKDRPRVAVGDRLRLARDAEGNARLLGIEPRRSSLSRPDPGDPRRELTIAANIDVAVIVISARSPSFKPALVDRVLIALEHGGVAPFVCVNKVDLVDDPAQRALLERSLAGWAELGVPGALVSAESGEGVELLRAAVHGKTCVFVGHSGVGKSTLLNAVDPDGERLTGHVREGDGKGRHTTTSSQLVELSDGTCLVDTPGVRQFGLQHVERAEVDAAFPDVLAFAGSCRFRDCSHMVEPDCAVAAAAKSGALSKARLEAWRRLVQEVEG